MPTPDWARFSWIRLSILVVASILCVLALQHQNSASPVLPDPSLKDLAAKKHMEIGNFAIPSRLSEEEYRKILTSEFSFVLMDNQPNWQFTDYALRPAPDKYDYSRMDEVMKFAYQNHMAVQAHHFVWGDEKWLPDWLKNGNYTPDQLKTLITDHIMNVGEHYKGQIREWTVVNEAFTRQQHLYGLHDWWGDHVGDQSFIDQAFIAARQADPSAKLLLNDFGNETKNSVSDAMYNYIADAKKRGVPIDGIGMQMHIDGSNPPSKDAVIDNMRRFGKLGVEVYVTEFDVNMNEVKGIDSLKQLKQAQIYHDLLRACMESNVCHSFAILGVTDKETWYTYMGIPNAKPLPFDKEYDPKPAFDGLRKALLEN